MKTVSQWIESVGVDGVRQAIGELRGYARHLRRNEITITASQIECVCDLAETFILAATDAGVRWEDQERDSWDAEEMRKEFRRRLYGDESADV